MRCWLVQHLRFWRILLAYVEPEGITLGLFEGLKFDAEGFWWANWVGEGVYLLRW